MERRHLERVIRLVFLQVSVVFLAAVVAARFGGIDQALLLEASVLWVAVALLTAVAAPLPLPDRSERVAWAPWVLALFFVAAVALRVLHHRHTALPLGYDDGFYRAAMEGVLGGFDGQAAWSQRQFPQGLLALQAALAHMAGLDSLAHVRFLFPVLAAASVVPVYLVARHWGGDRAALASAALAFGTFAGLAAMDRLYEKNLVALGLLLLATWCAGRRAWLPLGLLLASIAIWHRPTFLLAGVGFAAFAVWDLARRRDAAAWRGWALAAGTAVVLAVPVWLAFPVTFTDLLAEKLQRSAAGGGGGLGGSFVTVEVYHESAVAYLGLGLLGAAALVRRGQAVLPALLVVLVLANVLAEAILFRRFLLMLDLLVLPLAGIGLVALLAAGVRTDPGVRWGHTDWGRLRRWEAPVVAVLVLATAAPTLAAAWDEPEPPTQWVDDEAWQGLRWIDARTHPSTVMLVDNLAGPLAAADSGRAVASPGLFDDPNKRADWDRVRSVRDPARIEGFLAAYGSPLAVYHAGSTGAGLGTAKFDLPPFAHVYHGAGAHVWTAPAPTQAAMQAAPSAGG
ncbi:MAG: hypothetical protein ACPGQL_11160 [Thermoplasmatota archaeon]